MTKAQKASRKRMAGRNRREVGQVSGYYYTRLSEKSQPNRAYRRALLSRLKKANIKPKEKENVEESILGAEASKAEVVTVSTENAVPEAVGVSGE